MENDLLIYKTEIEKINQRIKEYLWKKKYFFKIKKNKSKNIRTRFLAKKKNFWKIIKEKNYTNKLLTPII